MLPRVGGMIPARQRNVVVLPAPLGPTRPMTSPGCTEKRQFVHGDEFAIQLGKAFNLNLCVGTGLPMIIFTPTVAASWPG